MSEIIDQYTSRIDNYQLCMYLWSSIHDRFTAASSTCAGPAASPIQLHSAFDQPSFFYSTAHITHNFQHVITICWFASVRSWQRCFGIFKTWKQHNSTAYLECGMRRQWSWRQNRMWLHCSCLEFSRCSWLPVSLT